MTGPDPHDGPTAGPTLVLLAHGTGDAAGRATLGRLLVRLRAALPATSVVLAYAGVARPDIAAVLPRTEGPVVVVPAFLAAGFHVRVDVPGQLAALPADVADRVALAAPLGPDPTLVDAALERLRDRAPADGAATGGPAHGPTVGPTDAGAAPVLVLAAAGSTDPAAQQDLRTAAAVLSDRAGTDVPVGYIAGGAPRVADVVAATRSAHPGRPVALVTWLLAPGAFHRWLADTGADRVGDPLGDHPAVVDAVVARYRAASGVAAAAR